MSETTKKTKYRTACIVGVRPRDLFGLDDRGAYKPLRERLEQAVDEAHRVRGIDTFVTGGAQGTDQLAFWAVHNIRRVEARRGHPIDNVVFAPYDGQSRHWRRHGSFGRDDYALMDDKATNVVTYAERTKSSPHPNTLITRRNREMVEHASIVITVWPADRDVKSAHGSVAATIRDAIRADRFVYNIDPATLEGAPIADVPAFHAYVEHLADEKSHHERA